MSFESEVIPLFIGCSAFVLTLELLVGLTLLKERKIARYTFTAHVVLTAIALFFLMRCIFNPWFFPAVDPFGDSSAYNSVNIALFGVCWALSTFELVSTIDACIHYDS